MNKFLKLKTVINSQRYVWHSRSAFGSYCGSSSEDAQQRRNTSFQTPKHSQIFQNSSLLTCKSKFAFPKQNALNLSAFRYLSTSQPPTTPLGSSATEVIAENVKEVIDISSSNSETIQTAFHALVTNPVVQQATTSMSQEVGFSWYLPTSWMCHYLELLSTVFPWWGAIAVATLTFRVALFPCVIVSQRLSSKMMAVLPEQQKLKERMDEAKAIGDKMEFARLSTESLGIYKKHGVNPLKSMGYSMAQMPVFISLFFTLKDMANHPVESMTTGGALWFHDLTIADPFYALPILTAVTLWITLESSFRSGMNPNQTPVIKYGARILPFVTLAFTYDFPAAILAYWGTNNIFSMIQVFVMRHPTIRDWLNIPPIPVKTETLAVNQKTVKTHFKDVMRNAKINKMMQERKTLDEMSFKKAGIGPLKKTFKENPWKSSQTN